MTPSAITLHTYAPPPICQREILRYMGEKTPTSEVQALLDSCIREAEGVLSYRVCERVYPIAWHEDELDLGFARVQSQDLRRALKGCDRVAVFAATVGLGIDRLIARYSRLSPSRALCLQALGSERVEALCDAFCQELADRAQVVGDCIGRRFSPGYGDLPLSMQREVFAALDCTKRLGIILQESLLMIPGKSVTAIVGVGKEQS